LGGREELASHRSEFRAFAPDVVVDFILSSGRQAEALMNTFCGIAKRVVALSSGDVYRAAGILHGTEPGPIQPVPLTEESEVRTKLNVYPPEVLQLVKAIYPWLGDDYDKIPVEAAVRSNPDLPGTVLRLPMVYGPGDPLHRLFPYLKRMDDGRAAILIQEDAAKWRGPRGYVENVAAAIALATVSDKAAGQVYNVSEAEACSEMEWVRKIGRAANWSGAVLPVAKESTPSHLRVPYNSEQHWVYSTVKIREQIGFKETVDEHTALERAIAWERANPPARVDKAQFDYAAEDVALATAEKT
jgi:nucleoside-diphosphate-sugar epimerase